MIACRAVIMPSYSQGAPFGAVVAMLPVAKVTAATGRRIDTLFIGVAFGLDSAGLMQACNNSVGDCDCDPTNNACGALEAIIPWY